MAYPLFNLRAWQSFCTISLQVIFGLLLGLAPSTSYSIHLFTQSLSSFYNGTSWTKCKSFAPCSRQPCQQYLTTQFLQAWCPSCHPTKSVKALKEYGTPTAWIYSTQFKLWSPQLHQHLCLHSTCHLNNRTYPPTPDLHRTGYWIQITTTNKWFHHFVHAMLYTTVPVYPLLTTSTLYWILTNASTTDTLCQWYSFLHYLLPFSLITTLQ